MSESAAVRGPVIILVEPQMGENIGMAARAMANFGLAEMRIVNPRDGWPNEKAEAASAGALHVLSGARVFGTVAEAVADLNVVFATTARERGQQKRVFGADGAMAETVAQAAAGAGVGVLFGRERTGLDNDAVALADAIITFPVNPAHASLNLAQAVLLVGYEWFKASGGGLPFSAGERPVPATREAVLSFFDYLEGELDAVGFFMPPEKRSIMVRNLRNIFHRLTMTDQDVRTLRGAVVALVQGRRGGRNLPRKGRAGEDGE
ncbi:MULTISPECIES: RNA methyltransferase [unclassified Chelatococcus]|uniref:RNA methyltransferase n=1 Tax=unclassified Chelatococcus TaxID=2638111 RepID=UPI00030F35BA|nr:MULTISPECIES: RNA methyltransferase [unclassified Chelatococcus]ALA16264.1 RNA methyltransferase [Chelatococcus sp. CO-6]